MPVNKNASFRYRVIDRCLNNPGRDWTLEDLIEEISDQLGEQFGKYIGISKRTVQGDINIMRSDPPRGYAAPIVCEDGCYSYEDPEYSIIDHPLIQQDITNLKNAMDILKQFRGFPHFKGLEQVVYKIEGQVQNEEQGVVQFESNEDVSGIKWLETLYNAALSKTVLKIRYKPFHAKQARFEYVHPILLKEYRNRWFLIGFNETLDFLSNYALDRIEEIINTKKAYNINKATELKEAYSNIIGVSIPKGVDIIRIVFDAVSDQAPYILTKPIHSSQEVIESNENHTRFSIKIIPNFELEQLFLSFGERVSIIEPDTYREKIKNRLNAAYHKYT